jgi:hypothetical protein
VIEWCDFYIFGSLAATISPLVYPQGDTTLALIAAVELCRPLDKYCTAFATLHKLYTEFIVL